MSPPRPLLLTDATEDTHLKVISDTETPRGLTVVQAKQAL